MRNFWTEFSLAIRALVVIAITIAVCHHSRHASAAACQSQRHESKPALPRRLEPESWHPSRGRGATQSTLVFHDWYRSLFVADDGKHLVTQYDGLNLLLANFMTILCCSRSGAKEKSFAMSESEISYRTTTFWGRLLRTIIRAR